MPENLKDIARALRGLTYAEMRELSQSLASSAAGIVRTKYNSLELCEVINNWTGKVLAVERPEVVLDKPIVASASIATKVGDILNGKKP